MKRIPAWRGLVGTSGHHPVQPPAEAGAPTAGCTAPRPGGVWVAPEKETLNTFFVLLCQAGLHLLTGSLGAAAGDAANVP